ncbi:MAG: hypothetical protein ACOYL6_00930 [Bacteriovoracaceae bacterium]
MHHLFFIDPLANLNIKKDSSLMMAASFQAQGQKVSLLFEKDFFLLNKNLPEYTVHQFEAEFEANSFYLKKFITTTDSKQLMTKDVVIHLRLDPPFDTRYLRIMWLLDQLQARGVTVVNNAKGVLTHNEKLFAYEHVSSMETYVGSSLSGFRTFVKELNAPDLIMKPLDLFQGIGVEKVSKSDPALEEIFMAKVVEHKGAVVVQAFNPKVVEGETRALFFDGKELGSIMKIPKQGEFLANIAQGASYFPYTLSASVQSACVDISMTLKRYGVRFVAFDILGDSISEVNITCPGLLVEVSSAHKKNLALEILKGF